MITIDNKEGKGKFYPYLICVVIVIYLISQFLAISSTSNINTILKEVSHKQTIMFEFLIKQSIESSLKISVMDDILDMGINNKENLLRTVSFNKNIKVYDINFFDIDGNLLNENYEGITSFSTICGDISVESIIEPTVINIRYSKSYNDTVMDILIPIYENDRLIGIMWQTESFERINHAMKSVSILTTGESYIIDETGRVLTDLKKADNKDKVISIKESKLKQNILDGFENKPYLDYNDEYVYGYHTNLNLNRWKLIVEIDEDEVKTTSKNINSFLIRTTTLLLAASKLLDPILKNRKKEIKLNKITCEDTSLDLDKSKKTKYYIGKSKNKIACMIKVYKGKKDTINMTLLIIIIIMSGVSFYKFNVDRQIQYNLNVSNEVNRKLISYYVNEIKGQFYSANKIISEYDNVNMYEVLENTSNFNSEILNIIVLEEDNNHAYNISDNDINYKYSEQVISNNHNIYNQIKLSDIFYDENYDDYVFYMGEKVIDNKTNQLKDVICVVSIRDLIYMLSNNELYPSRQITILNDNKIMYSNSYNQSTIPYESYIYLKSNMNKDYEDNSIFDVVKYKNIDDVEVYADLDNIRTNEVMVYGSYGSINDTSWQLLYEEPVDIAKDRAMKNSLELVIKITTQYIQDIINSI